MLFRNTHLQWFFSSCIYSFSLFLSTVGFFVCGFFLSNFVGSENCLALTLVKKLDTESPPNPVAIWLYFCDTSFGFWTQIFITVLFVVGFIIHTRTHTHIYIYACRKWFRSYSNFFVWFFIFHCEIVVGHREGHIQWFVVVLCFGFKQAC